MTQRYLCIHGHFYQPPRENPWLGLIEAQVSASPFHDWNERITRECYAPNGRARILGNKGRIVDLVNNYAYMSFNFGPTLLSWMEHHSPEAYKRILAADAESCDRLDSHGNALAQVYNHIIMPLASTRDRLTQIRWGRADFERRFGRKPEGMWLAETAVDMETLRLLASEGIRFTILAPNQAAMVRTLNENSEKPAPGDNSGALSDPNGLEAEVPGPASSSMPPGWKDVRGGRIDPRRPYRVFLDDRNDLFIDVFFYDGPVSRAIAFEKLLESGATFLSRIESAYGSETSWPRLVNLATDGESYGHHFHFGDMALAWVFNRILQGGSEVTPLNYAAFLNRFPPRHEVRIVENSSWSCAHGVERWRSDCGCSTGGESGWNQAWRGPLREGLDWLSRELANLFEREAGRLLKDPWAARDDYITVMQTPGPQTRSAFIDRHAVGKLEQAQRSDVLALMESQVMALYMFTSCGWFFDDISGLEPVQNMKYAARAIDLTLKWADRDLEAGLCGYLSRAQSNNPLKGTGEDIYRREIAASRMDPALAAAHWALVQLVSDYEPVECPVARACSPLITHRIEQPGLIALFGRIEIQDHKLEEKVARSYLALQIGGSELICLVGVPELDVEHFYPSVKSALADISSDRALELFREAVPGTLEYGLDDLIPDTRHHLVQALAREVFEHLQGWVLETYDLHQDVLKLYRESGEPLNYIERFLFKTVVGTRLSELLDRAMIPAEIPLEDLEKLAVRARAWGVQPADPTLREKAAGFLHRMFEELKRNLTPENIRQVEAFLKLARENEQFLDLWEFQNSYYDLWRDENFRNTLDSETLAALEDLGLEMRVQADLPAEKKD